ncbi:beta/gamma crystallin domain-containing protein 2 [Pelodytes ibericus]
MSSEATEQSTPAVGSTTTKKKSLRKRFLKLFSRSDTNLKVRTSSEGSKSPTGEAHGEEHLDRKGRYSWSEKRGKRNRHDVQDGISEGAQSLRHPRPEDAVLRRTSRTSKTRSLSYSELELPASGFLQRFGSLTWRKKRHSASEYSDAFTAESSTTDSHTSIGKLVIDSEINIGNRRPRSCIVESQCASPSLKSSMATQRSFEVSTSFDCLANNVGGAGFFDEENVALGSSLTQTENLLGEEEESLPHWAENILNEYLPQSHAPQGSMLYPGSGNSQVLGVLEEGEEPQLFQSPFPYCDSTRDQERKYILSQKDTLQFYTQINCSTCTEVKTFTPQEQRQLKPSIQRQNNLGIQPTKSPKSLYTIILTQEKVQKDPCQIHMPLQNPSYNVRQSNKDQNPLQFINLAEKEILRKQSPHRLKSHSQDEVDKSTTEVQNSPLLQTHLQDGIQKIHLPLYSSILGQDIVQKVSVDHPTSPKENKDLPRRQTSPITPKIRYEVIITMAKEEREREGTQVPRLGGDLLRRNELVGPDLKLSPSLESQACGYHGAGLAGGTAQEYFFSQVQTPKDREQEEEISKETKGGKTCKGAHLDRSLDLAIGDTRSLTSPGSELKVAHSRLDSSKMEKEGNQKKERSCSPFRTQQLRTQHTEKPHGHLNPRPGKIILFSEPGLNGQKHEIYSDLGNLSSWELQESISVSVIRGGWLLYEKPLFRGKRLMLLEGDTDLTCPWKIHNKEEVKNKNRSWIGSLRHVVKDFQVPQISLFLKENGEGEKVKIVGAAPDTRVNGQPIQTESIIVHSGLWLLYSKPFFEGDPYILESGGYPNRKAWGGLDTHLCALQPARIGGPIVEKPNEPKLQIFQYPGFEGPIWEVTRDLHSIQGESNSQGDKLNSVGSLKILGGCWVGYEKEGFRGHQYLLEEGEFRSWSHWGGRTEELGSLRLIRTDFSEPEIVLYEEPGCSEGQCLRLSEPLTDMEMAQYRNKTGSIHVLSGVWVAYENVDFSGEQYVLEKGTYHNYQDWGAENSTICSVQPVLQLGGQNLHFESKIQLFSEPNFHGNCMSCEGKRISIPESFSPKSCRVEGGSWILYEDDDCIGEQYILSEGDYPTRTAMGCLTMCVLRSVRRVPFYFSIPSISLHGLERFEGKVLEFSEEVRSLQGEGYNNHVLSVSVESGIWVVYEHSDFRGRQWLLERTQIPNWLLYSGLQRIGSLCPIRQRRVYFRLRNRAMNLFLCVPEQTEDMKAARVLITELNEGSCELWYYEDGRIKNQIAPHMSLQVIGQSCSGTKVVLWADGRKPIQLWSLEDSGYILSHTFRGMCLDIKGGHSYDADHVVMWEIEEARSTQLWNVELF